MASTRFYDDPARIAAYLELQTNAGRYALNVPGNGEKMPYQEDVHIRMQKWGANLDKNSLSIEDELRGMNRPFASKDAFVNVYEKMPETTVHEIGFKFREKYETVKPYTDESRASYPAWEIREVCNSRWETPFINPQSNIEIRFENNVQTRIMEKDNYLRNFGESGVNK